VLIFINFFKIIYFLVMTDRRIISGKFRKGQKQALKKRETLVGKYRGAFMKFGFSPEKGDGIRR